ncbi:MAG: hypothetical protein OXI61_10490 [Candidatus Poribacteria bacterium]|nr:hypothetical protein [Candidatus Poribacteria bacterium]
MNSYANDWTRYLSNTTLLPKSSDICRGISLFLWLAFIASVSLSLFFPTTVEARPEFATELEKECSFCHLDPAGGGPRNRVGEIFEENYFEFPEDFDMEAVTEEVKEVVKRLTTSFDFQTAFIKTTHANEADSEGSGAIAGCNSCHSSVDRFLLMQAEVTFNAEASEHVRLTLSNNAGTTMNAFATVDAIPKHLYVKVGQFRLPFAIKQKDHNILVREGYGLGSNKRDVGVEIGGSAGKIFYNAAFFNANTSEAKGGLGTFGAQLGPIRAGASAILEKSTEDWERLIGAFLTASYAGVSIEGEFNFGNSGEVAAFTPDAVDSKGYYVGAKYRILPQFTVAGRYGLFDPDRRVKGDASQRVTLSAQYNFIENGAISLFYWANLANADRNADDTIKDKGTLRQLQGADQIILMSRFWF